jgi:hypothetical protein
MSTIKIIRTYWGSNPITIKELSPFPVYPKQEIVYVWGEDNESMFKQLGYETRLVSETLYPYFNTDNTQYGNKLVVLKLALEEFKEVMMLDWDCYILRPLDNQFYEYLKSKPIQCPLYSHHSRVIESLAEAFPNSSDILKQFFVKMEEGFGKYRWVLGEGSVSPNFGMFYTRDREVGQALLDIAIKNELQGCIEEHAFFLYVKCTLEEYLEKYQPYFVQGVSQDRTNHDLMISKVQANLNNYIDSKLPMDLYLKHI